MRNRNGCIRHNSLPVTALRYTPVTLLQMTPYSCRMLNMVGVTVNTYCLPISFHIRLACLANTNVGDTIKMVTNMQIPTRTKSVSPMLI